MHLRALCCHERSTVVAMLLEQCFELRVGLIRKKMTYEGDGALVAHLGSVEKDMRL